MSQRQRIQIAQQQRLALNASLSASIRFLRGDAAGLTRYLEEQAADNPHLRLVPPEAPALGDWLPRWTGVFSFGGQEAGLAEAPSAAPSLIAHVLQGVAGLRLPPRALRIAEALTEALEPSGWLGRAPAAIAAELALPLPEVEAVLAQLQRLDPPGLFARSLAECLRLQALDQGVLDAIMSRLLDNLDLLASGETARLARLCHCDAAAIAARFRAIRGMNPKPGADFALPQRAALREPDLLARPLADGGWQIALNRSCLPDLEVQPQAQGATEKLSEARALAHMLKARNATLLRVAREIAARQRAALHHGPGALVPMTMAEIAESLSLHASTISRVVNGAALDSPRGTWWLRQMFSGARGGDPTSETEPPRVAAAALRHRVAALVAAENRSQPLSDQALALAIRAETGVALARRTIAKYREMQGIPPAHARRRAPVPHKSASGRRKAGGARAESLDATGESS